jgi:hypothetical protein
MHMQVILDHPFPDFAQKSIFETYIYLTQAVLSISFHREDNLSKRSHIGHSAVGQYLLPLSQASKP